MLSKNSPNIRLQKYIADAGVTSRRKAEELISLGRVEVNGEVIRTLGTKIDPHKDVIHVDGSVVDPKQVQKIYLVMHKPRGVMTTVYDPEGRETVMDFCKEISERIYPVGRLDYLSEGLLILTNDGELANKIIHPSSGVEKVYEVKVFGIVTPQLLKKLQAGVQLEEGFVRPLEVRILKYLPSKTWLEFRLAEGKNREVRRMCEAQGLTVDKLKRIAIGGLSVNGIAPGKYQLLSKKALIQKIGLGKKSDAHRYISPKKSLRLKKSRVKVGTPADQEIFQIYRKDRYFQTIKEIEVSRQKKAEEEALKWKAEKSSSYRK